MHMPNEKERTRAGFALAEIMVGMTLLAILLSSIAGLTFSVSRRMIEVSRGTGVNAAVSRDVNRFSVLPYDSLSAHAGCDSITAATETFAQCVTVTTPSTNTHRVTIVTTPLVRAYTSKTPIPDTVIIDRLKMSSTNPLNSP